jgi:tetratricopeptide (TPR) repeat protein
LLPFLTLVGAGGVLVLSATPGLLHFGWVILNLALFLVFQALIIVPHEAGHALAARLVGLRVFRVIIGQGPILWSCRLGRMHLEIRTQQTAGFTVIGHPTVRWFRLCSFLMILAGPLVNLVLLLVALWALPSSGGVPDLFAGWPGPLLPFTFLAAIAFLVLVGLFPWLTTVNGQRVPSDGLQLLLIPFLSRQAIEQAHAHYFVLEANECLEAGRPADALRWYERGLEHYPADPMNAYGVASVLFKTNELARARQYAAERLKRQDLPPLYQALYEDLAATVILHLIFAAWDHGMAAAPETEELLQQAEEHCHRALIHEAQLAPETCCSMYGTLGCIFIEGGKLEEGEVLLRKSLARLESPQDRAYCYSYLAVAAARRGEQDKARQFLESARTLKPEHPALKRALREWPAGQ